MIIFGGAGLEHQRKDNIKGNKYRLILDIDYEEQVAYFKYFLTHAEYDKEQWKNDPYY